ncbi:hypothetical protein CTAYLR_004549 [Chrysophaeum taylorii]|uniref:Cap-specific mRNA (nucleoside-2'-O-)-methyltransferase 1 n=1 Tax=Chrysophaeum taylorii TaxID=2483200 RepID=A0AAD7UMW4_9STRA|nr:hypothetical protein CTAYLR_004549 [Chrysophaeum taylorii]
MEWFVAPSDARVEDALAFADASRPGAEESELVEARSALGGIETKALRAARAALDPFDNTKLFVCRSALKLAELDAISGFSLRGRFVDVCAAPGGFSEYLSWRGCEGYAMSLRGPNENGVGVDYCGTPCATVVEGDGTGDIYDRGNARALVDAANPADVCVADGGFDSNKNATDQDAALERLALCEAAIALSVLGPGGAFVLKLFLPLRSRGTVRIVAACAAAFDRVAILKPKASRAASGEVYLLALGYRRDERIAATFHDWADGQDPPPRASSERSWLDRAFAPYLRSRRATFIADQADACRAILSHARHPIVTEDAARFVEEWRLSSRATTKKRRRGARR